MSVTRIKRKSRKNVDIHKSEIANDNDSDFKENIDVTISVTNVKKMASKRRFTRSQAHVNELNTICDDSVLTKPPFDYQAPLFSIQNVKVDDHNSEDESQLDGSESKNEIKSKKKSRKTLMKAKKRGRKNKNKSSIISIHESDSESNINDQDAPAENMDKIEEDTPIVTENMDTNHKPVMNRESTIIIDRAASINPKKDSLIIVENEMSKSHTFSAASPCKLFKKITTPNKFSMKTPAKTLCRAISVGSAGQTPMPKSDKIKLKSQTPNIKAVALNVTHSIEKPMAKAIPKQDINKKKISFKSPNRRLQFTKKAINPPKPILQKPFSSTSSNRVIPQAIKPIKNTVNVGKMKPRGISKPVIKNKKVTLQISEEKAKNIISMVQSTFEAKTPSKTLLKPIQPISRTKMPNFTSLHQKQFDRMESLIQNKSRREQRAKKLLEYVNTPTVIKGSKADSAPNYTRFGFKIDDNYKNLPNVCYEETPRTRSTLMTIVKKQTKSVAESLSKTDNIKSETNFIVGVRTNRRFELQMKARNGL